MTKAQKIQITTDKYCRAANKATDFFIASWKLKGEKKTIALVMRERYRKEARTILDELIKLTNG